VLPGQPEPAAMFERSLYESRSEEVRMQFFKRKVMYPHRRTSETSRAIDKQFAEYASHLKRIRDSLPEGARVLADNIFHDATIREVKQLSRTELQIVIEGGGHGTLKYGEYILSFTGVRKGWVPHTIAGDTWLYHEIHLSDDSTFDFQVLLVKDEIRIQATGVQVIPRTPDRLLQQLA
jgi:Protein of unknown function (DUF4085)